MLRLITSLSSICLLMAMSSMAQGPPVLDTDGNPLTRGVEYYVDPAITDVAGGLTLVARNGSCPSYVRQVPIGPGSVEGLPVTFTPSNPGDTIITETTEFTVAFSASSTCVQNTTWGIGEEDPETRRRFIVIGGNDHGKGSENKNKRQWQGACFLPGMAVSVSVAQPWNR